MAATASAPSRASSSSSSSRSRSRSRTAGSSSRRYVWFAVAAVALIAAVWLLRRHGSSSAAPLDTSGTPGPDLTGSAAQTPSGGAGGVVGNLPATVTQPDTVQTQVQQTDTSSAEAPSMLPPAPSVGDPILSTLPIANPPGVATPLPPDPGTFAAVTGTPIYQAPAVGTAGVVVAPGQPSTPALVDVSGHVVSPKGTRVGGVPIDY